MTDKKIMVQCDLSLKEYRIQIDPIKWYERSILLSEGLLVCAMADLMDVDIFIESGVYEGKSTEIWGRYFAHRRIPVFATDVVLRKGVRERLSYLPDVTLYEVDGSVLIKNIVTEEVNRDKRIGVFIDGPKGEIAANLAEELIGYSNVKFVAVHDCHKMSFGEQNYPRIALEKHTGDKFFSDNELFVDTYSYLDRDSIGKLDEGQHARWYPGEIRIEDEKTRVLGSYGPTVGVIL